MKRLWPNHEFFKVEERGQRGVTREGLDAPLLAVHVDEGP